MFTKATPSPSLNYEMSEICPRPKELTIGSLEGHGEQTRTRDRHCPLLLAALPQDACRVRRTAMSKGHMVKVTMRKTANVSWRFKINSKTGREHTEMGLRLLL